MVSEAMREMRRGQIMTDADAEIFAEALERLRYGARRGQWSTDLTAEMCRVVVEELESLESELIEWEKSI